jgi:uncharacterized protein
MANEEYKMIHKYKLFGYNIAIDIESGSVHLLSDAAYNMLGYLENLTKNPDFTAFPDECPVDIRYHLAKFNSSDINGAYSELVDLYEENLLFTKPEKIELEYTDIVKALCLNIAHDCNLMCEYCFAGKGDFGLSKNSKKLMSEETGLQAIQFLMENSGGRRNLEVDFFGGEPLLNFETVKNIVLKTRELEKDYHKNVRFTLTTNGTLLDDEQIDFINEHISNIVLSLDGLPETNDSVRRYNDGSGSYSDIVPLYQKLISRRVNKDCKDYYVRGTFTRKNLNFTKDVIHMAELGFTNISVEPVVLNDTDEYSIRREDLPAVCKEYENLAREIIRRVRGNHVNQFNFFHFNIDLDEGPCLHKRSKGCGAGSEYLAVTPEGEIYPCHQFVGNADFKLGDVNNPGQKNPVQPIQKEQKELMKKLFDNNIIRNEACSTCWVKYFCGGGCAANNQNFNGDICEPYEIACEMEKKRVECAIAIQAVLSV